MAVIGAESLTSDQPGDVATVLASEERARQGRKERACRSACVRLRTQTGDALQPSEAWMMPPGWSLPLEKAHAGRPVCAARPQRDRQLGLLLRLGLDDDKAVPGED